MDPESRGLQFLHIITIIYLAIVDIIHMIIMIYPYIIINHLFHDWEFTIIPIYSPYIIYISHNWSIFSSHYRAEMPCQPQGISRISAALKSQGSKTLSLAACRRHVQKTAGGSPWVTHRLGIHIWGVNRYGLRPLRPGLDNSKATTGRSKRVLPGPGGVHWCFVRRWSSLLYCESSRKVQCLSST